MANSWYGLGINDVGEGLVGYSADTIKVSLVTSATYSLAINTDHYYSIIPGGAVIAAGVALGTKTSTLGTWGAANTTWTSVAGPTAAQYIVGWKDTTVPGTSPLLFCIDTATGLPVTPIGGDITAAWSSGQVAILRQSVSLINGMEGRKEPRRVRQWWEFLNDVLGIPAVRDASGIWIPTPRLIVAPARG